ncbi:MAG: AAA domain-containing protein, partial [Bacilli bacterium]|nr:AAA domain-containing protein [Bacilli bacterium]
MNPIALIISRSIRESKWVKISYRNSGDKKSDFWCCIIGIEIEKRILQITAFNLSKIENSTKGIIETNLFFENIIRATVIEHTSYNRPVELVPFIEKNLEKLDWLSYDLFSDNLINYYKKCIHYDTDPYCTKFTFVEGIDDQILNTQETKIYPLSLTQQAQLIKQLERVSKVTDQKKRVATDLAFNFLSIETPRGLYVVAYYIVTYNPKESSLILSDELLFNQTFLSDTNKESKHSLYSYFDRDCEDFTDLLANNPDEAKNQLMSVLRNGEYLDDSPHFMDINRRYNYWVSREFDYLAKQRSSHQLSTPLKAFFGEMSHDLVTSLEPQNDVIIMDYPLNPDQIRSIHNGLNYPITYVQGPPGTGKTTAIQSLIISSFFNNQTVLVTSNNNKPMDDLYNQLKQFTKEGYDIRLPLLRLGNDTSVLNSLKDAKYSLKLYKIQQPIDSALDNFKRKNKKQFQAFNEILAKYEEREMLKEKNEVLNSMIKELSTELRAISMIQVQIDENEKQLMSLEQIDDSEIRKYDIPAGKSFYQLLYYSSIKYHKLLLEDEYKELLEIINIENQKTQIKEFNQYISIGSNLEKLLKLYPIIITTNQSAYRLGEPREYFDLVVMDEAGQCSIGYSLVPILRGKRLMLVGDQKQLRPVLSLSHEANHSFMKKYRIPSIYSYNTSSILLAMQEVDRFSKSILLREHYRCNPQIISFCNQKYYDGKLIIKNNSTDMAVFAIPVKQDDETRQSVKNISSPEIERIINHARENSIENYGVVTPFHNQALLLKEKFANEGLGHIPTGTVHLFQGDEKDVIYCSLAINNHSSNRTFGWLKNNEELINVAMTRARKAFYLVGDLDHIQERSTNDQNDINDLVEYVKSKGTTTVLESVSSLIAHQKELMTPREKALFESLRQLFSISNAYRVEKQISIKSILSNLPFDELFDYGTRGVFDFVVYSSGVIEKVVLVIELDGPEHEEDEETIVRDKKKEQICEKNGIALHRIK